MKVYFEKTIVPCVADEVINWHVAHGWVWNVRTGEKCVGVFFATLLSGDGVIIHFTPKPDLTIPPALTLAAFRKGVKIASPLGVVFATVPRSKTKLVSVVKRLGFAETNGSFIREGVGEIVLLKYLKNPSAILDSHQP